MDTIEAIESEPVPQQEAIELQPGQPSYRILIVEDQLENQLLLKRLMSDLGLETKLAENGKESIRIFQEWQPDLIWMDRRMPVMDGEEAARHIRQLPRGDKVKIVAVTASAFKEEHEAMIAAGMDEVVSKPYRFEEICSSLTRQLGLRFFYKETTAERMEPILDAKELAVLPVALRVELKEALESLDAQAITAVIQQVGDLNAELAKILSKIADNFDYETILRALEQSHNQPEFTDN
jgi:CheY-like chemotaxis protein